MKKLIFAAIMLLTLCVNNSSAQDVVREGKTFKQVNKSVSHKADTLVTQYTYIDNMGIEYPIIINKNTGSCYIWKTSKKGNMYKSYMKPEVSAQIAKELNIEYKPKNK